jgi:glucose/arabinose dehydrogenase
MPTRSPRRSGRLIGVAFAALGLAACGPAAGSPIPSSGGTAPTASAAAVTPVPTTAAPSAAPSVAAGSIRLDVVAAGLESPLDVTAADDGSGRLFVAEQVGRIRTVRDGALEATPFLDITDRIAAGGERGLLGIALHPDFPTDPRVFVDYTDLDGNTVVSAFTPTLDADVLDPGSEQILLQVEQPFPNHNGGAVAFGPDGMLYIALGDGGSAGDPQGNGQRLDTLLAKILRIDVDAPAGQTPPYGIPPDNPYADGANSARPETWLSGLRNPWRIRFDAPTGDLWIGDVGQGAWEEIDVARAGQGGLDLGWNVMEGFHCYEPSEGCDQDGLTLPVAEYGHGDGCAVVGGVVIHDPTMPSIDGRYLFSDNCSGNVWVLDAAGDARREPTIVLESGRSISAINQDGSGAVYATDLGSGELLRVAETGS